MFNNFFTFSLNLPSMDKIGFNFKKNKIFFFFNENEILFPIFLIESFFSQVSLIKEDYTISASLSNEWNYTCSLKNNIYSISFSIKNRVFCSFSLTQQEFEDFFQFFNIIIFMKDNIK